MAASVRDEGAMQIATRPWRVFDFSGGQRYVIKSVFRECSYELMITDYSRCWSEALKENDIRATFRTLNEKVEAPLATILKNLKEHLEEQKAHATYTVQITESTLVLSLDTLLSNLPFQWKFKANQVAHNIFSECLVLPLLGMACELQRRQDELARILKKKDKEIEDYKMVYGPPSRRHLETAPFNEKSFFDEMTDSQEFRTSVMSDSISCLSANQKISQLYCDVMAVRKTSNKLSSKETTENDGASVGVATEADIHTPTHQTAAISPKKAKLSTSPNKEAELQRREGLKKQLEEKQKGKRKKKKLI